MGDTSRTGGAGGTGDIEGEGEPWPEGGTVPATSSCKWC